VEEAEAYRKSTVAQNVAKANSEKESYEAQKTAEKARAEKDKATLYANEMVPAEIAKDKAIVDAEATAETTRRIAKGNADAVFMAKEAEANGIKAILEKQAEGFEILVKSAGGDPDKAIQLLIAEKLPELMRIQADAISNIKIDKITVWDSGNGGAEGGTTPNFIKGMLGALPAYSDLYKMTGKELPSMLNLQDAVDTEKTSTDESESLNS